jgi:hypothetical protein
MTLYMTKVWGFGVPSGPLLFGTNGWRERAREILRPGDLVVLVGTKTEQTAPGSQGRLLGMMEPTTEVAHSLDFELRPRAKDYDSEGNYRWPYALLNRRAWRFLEPRPLLEEISSRQFAMDSASGIVPLTPDEAERIDRLPKQEVPLLAPVRAVARIEGEDVARRRAAPPPTTQRAGVMHVRNAPAYTYAMKIEGATATPFKIGWAFDYKKRERDFNLASLPQLGGLRYRSAFSHLWDTARAAFKMEQAILRKFDAQRHPSNREVVFGISYEALHAAWIEYLMDARVRR